MAIEFTKAQIDRVKIKIDLLLIQLIEVGYGKILIELNKEKGKIDVTPMIIYRFLSDDK